MSNSLNALNSKNLTNILLELRSASIYANEHWETGQVELLMQKYNMLFLGKNFNTIYTHNLLSTLTSYFKLGTTLNDLNALVPLVCSGLQMKYEVLVALENADTKNPPTHSYSIQLW